MLTHALVALAIWSSGDEATRRAPFEALRWVNDVPQVWIDGSWNYLQAIDGVDLTRLMVASNELYGVRKWHRGFDHELVAVLTHVGHEPGQFVTLDVRDPATGEVRHHDSVPLTRANFRSVRARFNAFHGDPPGLPRVEREHSAEVEASFADLAQPLRFEAEGDVALTPERAAEDLDQLEWLVENRFAFRDRARIDRNALFDAARVGIAGGTTRASFAVLVARLLARFGQGESTVAGKLVLPAGTLPMRFAQTGEGIIALAPDGGSLLDPEHPYAARLDDFDVEVWIYSASVLSPGGTAPHRREDAIDRLVHVNWLRLELGRAASDHAVVELTSLDRKSIEKRDLQLVNAPMRTSSHGRVPRLLDGNFAYLTIDGDDVRKPVPDLATTDGLVLDVRGRGNVRRSALALFFPMFMRLGEKARVFEGARYRIEPGGERGFNWPHLQRIGMWPHGGGHWGQPIPSELQELERTFAAEWSLSNAEFSDWNWYAEHRGNESTEPTYDGPVVVLCDADTSGPAEVFVDAFRGWRNCAVIGTTTAGAEGAPLDFRLEHSGLVVQLATMVAFRRDGRLFDGHGIEPDIVVEKSIDDWLGCTDSQLDAAVQWLREHAAKPR